MKDFINHIADMGSVLFYLGIIIVAVLYPTTSIAYLAIIGFACAMYSQIKDIKEWKK